MSQNFCYHPFNGLEIETDGTIKPCCKFKTDLYPNWKNFNIRDGLDNYLNSQSLKNLQNDFINGTKPEACVRCWKDEEAGFPSKRQMDADRWGNQINDDKIKFLAIPIGNLCNLKCRICSPHSSSSWIKEFKDIYGIKIQKQEWHKDPKIWNEIIDISKSCIEIHIHGGEPFLYQNVEHVELIRQIVASKKADNISLHYSTNGTVFPSNELYDLWKNFKWVDIQLSLDDYGTRFEYNRYLAKWDQVEKNLLNYLDKVQQYSNHQISISTTVSAFTIYYLDEFFDVMKKLGVPKPWLGRLHNPPYYRPSIFPIKVKQKIEEKLLQSKHNDVKNTASWLIPDDTQYWQEFLSYIQRHDAYRKQKFFEVFPEVAKLAEINQ